MLYAMLAACATLILVLAVPRAAEARHLARLFRAQQEWAQMMDRQRVTPSAMPCGAARAMETTNPLHRSSTWTVALLGCAGNQLRMLTIINGRMHS
jgi:hypothetical protein